MLRPLLPHTEKNAMQVRLKTVMRVVALSAVLGIAVSEGAAQTPTARIVRAANVFLSTLDAAQKQRVNFAYDDDQQRARWSNFPVAMSRRAGLGMGELTPAQRTAAQQLLASAFSARGLEKLQQIVDGDEVLKANERNNPLFGKDLYFISFLGTPSDTAPWMLQFGGHHLAFNLTIIGDRGVLTPSLTAAQPAMYTLNGRTVRPLGQENDKAYALLNALTPAQRSQAVLPYRVPNLVLGPGQDGKTIQPEGLKASAMTAAQRTMLLNVIAEWAGIVHESAAAARMAELRADLDQTWFAWSGSTSVEPGQNGTGYYRIQGPHLVIEYSPQEMGGDPRQHVHTIYRDPTNDYGRKPAAK
jgi:hypothetical protein